MKIVTVIFVWLAFGACPEILAGHEGIGGIGLVPAPSVKAVAMGETGLADAVNVQGFAVNPASTPFAPQPHAFITYGTLVQGLSTTRVVAGAVIPLGTEISIPSLGMSLRRFGVGISLDHRMIELSQGSGWGTETISIGLGYRLTPYASFGLLSKLLFSNTDLKGSGVKAFGLDLSALLDVSRSLSLGLALRNAGASANWEDGEDEALPLLLSLGGVVILPRNISGAITLTVSDADRAKGGLGLDFPVLGTGFSLRGGLLHYPGSNSRSVPTFGFGYGYTRFQIDYAARFDSDTALGTTHHFSLAYMFGS